MFGLEFSAIHSQASIPPAKQVMKRNRNNMPKPLPTELLVPANSATIAASHDMATAAPIWNDISSVLEGLLKNGHTMPNVISLMRPTRSRRLALIQFMKAAHEVYTESSNNAFHPVIPRPRYSVIW